MLGEEKGLEATELSLGLKTSINSAHISALSTCYLLKVKNAKATTVDFTISINTHMLLNLSLFQ